MFGFLKSLFNDSGIKKTSLKYSTKIEDPFQGKVTLLSKKSFKFSQSKSHGFFSKFSCEFTISCGFVISETETFFIKVDTYRRLKAKSVDQMEKFMDAEPLWRIMSDLAVLADNKKLRAEILDYEPQHRGDVNSNRECWAGGEAHFSIGDFEKMVQANSVAVRYYGNCGDSEFTWDNAAITKLTQIANDVATDFKEVRVCSRSL